MLCEVDRVSHCTAPKLAPQPVAERVPAFAAAAPAGGARQLCSTQQSPLAARANERNDPNAAPALLLLPPLPRQVERGNFAAVGSFEPGIEIWDMDVLDAGGSMFGGGRGVMVCSVRVMLALQSWLGLRSGTWTCWTQVGLWRGSLLREQPGFYDSWLYRVAGLGL